MSSSSAANTWGQVRPGDSDGAGPTPDARPEVSGEVDDGTEDTAIEETEAVVIEEADELWEEVLELTGAATEEKERVTDDETEEAEIEAVEEGSPSEDELTGVPAKEEEEAGVGMEDPAEAAEEEGETAAEEEGDTDVEAAGEVPPGPAKGSTPAADSVMSVFVRTPSPAGAAPGGSSEGSLKATGWRRLESSSSPGGESGSGTSRPPRACSNSGAETSRAASHAWADRVAWRTIQSETPWARRSSWNRRTERREGGAPSRLLNHLRTHRSWWGT